ncbi:WD domain, G-beta repeat [Carpediemonas membranifera]|uniref:WD domain, G-beta repeat n=1 Tax=Carpediemonas membranifera TaxID=201153 RepID=A0A8J6B1E1_9EUKA|nr:WD domain, G-beta repeat [Carpediemonas membranifera]|eukprot:KAG9390869.1 WD domain, G-beta repeat [Carpediemonas membranifera]
MRILGIWTVKEVHSLVAQIWSDSNKLVSLSGVSMKDRCWHGVGSPLVTTFDSDDFVEFLRNKHGATMPSTPDAFDPSISEITQPVVRIEAAFSRSNDCRAVDAQIRTASSERPGTEGIQIHKRGETPITIQDLEKVIQYLLSERIEPEKLSMEFTELLLVANHANYGVQLVLYSWGTRSMADDTCFSTLKGHRSVVYAVAAPDDNINCDDSIITASHNGIKRWHWCSNRCLKTMVHGDCVWNMDVSPNGSTIASGGDDNCIKLWDAETGRRIKTLGEHNNRVNCLAFSSDGRTLVSGSNDKTAKIWDVERAQWNSATGECIRTMKTDEEINIIAVSPDGTIAAGSNNCIKFWDSATGQLTRTLDGHAEYGWSFAFSPDGRTLVSGSADKTVKQWDVATGELIRTLSGHSGDIMDVAFARNGDVIVSGSTDKTVKVWNTHTHTHQFLATVNQLCSSPVAPDADIAINRTLCSDLARILLHFIATGLPRSFAMTLTRPAARVWLEDKFAKTDSKDADLGKLIKLFNACRCDRLIADFCSGAVSDVVLVDVTIDQLRQVVSRVASSQVAPRDLRITMAAPSSPVIRMSDGAIHDLHSAGVCHRDHKPENVMLREGHPVLVDFETASAVNATATGVNIGTFAFSAPEEIAAHKAVRGTQRDDGETLHENSGDL